jgi:predicted nuclease of predicted toxin-antitoxin system
LKLQEFALLADENIHAEVLAYLRQCGCDVLDVRESGLIGSDDLALLRLARSQNRVVVTHDSDFGALAIARLEPLIGIVFLRPGHIIPQFTIGTLRALFEENADLTPPFIVVAKRRGDQVAIRLRKL